jgi:hypothetical protein
VEAEPKHWLDRVLGERGTGAETKHEMSCYQFAERADRHTDLEDGFEQQGGA